MKRLLLLPIIALALFACQKNDPDDLFGKTPAERFNEKESELRSALTSASQGWKLTYFTKEGIFGGYHFLMKFTPEGFVSMASDFSSNTVSATTSKYELQQGQGVKLTFTTKNYIHELSDAMQGKRGAGYAGEYQFLYYGKEGDKLKFKTQRNSTEQFVYFEPATAQDWTDISTLSSNLNTLVENVSNYYMKVTANGNTTDYGIVIQNGRIGVAPLSNTNNVSQASTVATKEGIAFKPALTIQGKKFTEFTRDNSTTPPTYKATVDGVTVEVYYAAFPPDAYVSDDYQALGTTVNELLFFADPLGDYASDLFVENILKIDNTKSFSRVYFEFDKATMKCTVSLLYKFPSKTNFSLLAYTYDYALRNKRLFLTNPQLSTTKTTDASLWNNPQNAAVLNAAVRAINYIVTASSEGFYVDKSTAKVKYTNTIYILRSRSVADFSFPAYAN